MKRLNILFALLLTLNLAACGGSSSDNETSSASTTPEEVEPQREYGIIVDGYTISNDTVRSGETLGGILGRRGISAVKVDRLDKA